MHSSILRRIWVNFMAQYFVFSALLQFSRFVFRISNFFGPSTTDETSLVEMRSWCIKIGIVLVLHISFLILTFGYEMLCIATDTLLLTLRFRQQKGLDKIKLLYLNVFTIHLDTVFIWIWTNFIFHYSLS
jgi:hypothetical protein